MKDIVFYFYGYVVFFYSMGLIVSYVILMWLAELGIFRKKRGNLSLYTKEIIDKSPYTPGVSIIAPAYNEERTIIENVNSLLGQDYPKFEVIIVNDGSKDKTLELLIENFQLVEVPFAYVEYIRTKPYRRLFKSTNPEYHRLIVVDKENGGTKADAVNAGLNASSYPYFVNIDVDGIIGPRTVAALRNFQSFNKLAVDGIAGLMTWKTMLFLPPYPTLRQGSTGVYVQYLQYKLQSKLYPTGRADGIFGPNTLSAVRLFQADNNLAVDGIVGPRTWEKLSPIAGGQRPVE